MGKTVRTKRRNEADPSDLERFVQMTTSMKYWPDINAKPPNDPGEKAIVSPYGSLFRIIGL
jgi:hypothetical protein